MRQWLARPELMCMAHRSGEHLEAHMFLGAMQHGKKLKGFYENGLFFGPNFLLYRHEELSNHIGGHKSPILSLRPGSPLAQIPKLSIDRGLYPDIMPTKVMRNQSLRTLLSRCPDCLNLHMRAKHEGKPIDYRVDRGALLRLTGVDVSGEHRGGNS